MHILDVVMKTTYCSFDILEVHDHGKKEKKEDFMEVKDFMYINKNITLDNTLQKHLLDYIAELEDY